MARKRKEKEQGEQHLDAAVDKAEETAGNVIDTAEAVATLAVEAGADIARKAKKILKGATRTAVSSGGKAAAVATEKAVEGAGVAADVAADVIEKITDVAADASEIALEKGSELAADAAEMGAGVVKQAARKGEELAGIASDLGGVAVEQAAHVAGDALEIAADAGSSAAEMARGAADAAREGASIAAGMAVVAAKGAADVAESAATASAAAVKGTAEAAGQKAGEVVAIAHDKLWPTYGVFVAVIVRKALSSAAEKGRDNVRDDEWFRGHVVNRTWELLPLPVRLAGKGTLRWEQVMFKLRDQVLTGDEGAMAVSKQDKSLVRSAIERMLSRKG